MGKVGLGHKTRTLYQGHNNKKEGTTVLHVKWLRNACMAVINVTRHWPVKVGVRRAAASERLCSEKEGYLSEGKLWTSVAPNTR